MNCCYILYSKQLNKFYIGATHESVEIRLKHHKTQFYGKNHYTSKSTDWEIYLVIEVKDYKSAIGIERKIKSMKSRTYIENLKRYPEMVDKLKKIYTGN